MIISEVDYGRPSFHAGNAAGSSVRQQLLRFRRLYPMTGLPGMSLETIAKIRAVADDERGDPNIRAAAQAKLKDLK